MEQIKTVVREINNADTFDYEVNRLLADGWKLHKRKVITTHGELSEAFNAPIVRFLYAELTRQTPPFPEEKHYKSVIYSPAILYGRLAK